MRSPSLNDANAYSDTNDGFGWKAFAAFMLVIAGSINLIQGLVAITNASYYENLSAGSHLQLPATDKISTWGWILLIWGLIVFVADFAARMIDATR